MLGHQPISLIRLQRRRQAFWVRNQPQILGVEQDLLLGGRIHAALHQMVVDGSLPLLVRFASLVATLRDALSEEGMPHRQRLAGQDREELLVQLCRVLGLEDHGGTALPLGEPPHVFFRRCANLVPQSLLHVLHVLQCDNPQPVDIDGGGATFLEGPEGGQELRDELREIRHHSRDRARQHPHVSRFQHAARQRSSDLPQALQFSQGLAPLRSVHASHVCNPANAKESGAHLAKPWLLAEGVPQ
mmetsp:Transcript_60119/g.196345  ORF Transcript_60119/g.196345 Transcript_60119/m.196345 type:complete len:244 (-) Transcript_60119:1919-2650(-)